MCDLTQLGILWRVGTGSIASRIRWELWRTGAALIDECSSPRRCPFSLVSPIPCALQNICPDFVGDGVVEHFEDGQTQGT